MEVTVSKSDSSFWLDAFHVCISPYGNLILLASKYELLVLTAKTEANGQLKYSLTSQISIESPEAKKSDDESLRKYLRPKK